VAGDDDPPALNSVARELAILGASMGPFRFSASPHKRSFFWIAVIAFFVIFMLILLWCYSIFVQGWTVTDAAVRDFHRNLNKANYEEICQTADQRFTQAGHQRTVEFLETVHHRLGDVQKEKPTKIGAYVDTHGLFVVSQYRTTFFQGSATETFTWIQRWGGLKLYRYYIEYQTLSSK
jgi:hypothetical protein